MIIFICHGNSTSETLLQSQSPSQKGSASKKIEHSLDRRWGACVLAATYRGAYSCTKHFINVIASSPTTLKMIVASFTDEQAEVQNG